MTRRRPTSALSGGGAPRALQCAKSAIVHGVGVGCGGAIEPSRKISLVAVGSVEPGSPSQSLVESGMRQERQRFGRFMRRGDISILKMQGG